MSSNSLNSEQLWTIILALNWRPGSIKQIQVFTDNPFHYENESRSIFNAGRSVSPPLHKWTTQPPGFYKYYDKRDKKTQLCYPYTFEKCLKMFRKSSTKCAMFRNFIFFVNSSDVRF